MICQLGRKSLKCTGVSLNPETTGEPSVAELQHRREEIRRGLSRAGIAFAALIALVVCLTAVAVIQMQRAQRNAARARDASTRAEQELWNAQLAQARAHRLSGLAGRRGAALQSLAAAARHRPSFELRDEAIATLGLIDLEEVESWRMPPWAEITALSPTLDHYACVAPRGNVLVFAAGEASAPVRLDHSEGNLMFMAFSPDGRFLAARFDDGVRIVWEWKIARVVMRAEMAGPTRGDTMAFSRDSQWFVTCGREGALRFFNLNDGTEGQGVTLPYMPSGFALHPDGETVAVRINNLIDLYRRGSSERLGSFTNTAHLFDMAWHPRGRMLAAGLGRDGVVLWHVEANTNRVLRGHTDAVRTIEFAREGEVLVTSAADGTTRLWDVNHARELALAEAAEAVVVSNDGSQIGFKRNRSEMGIWRLVGGDDSFRLNLTYAPTFVEYLSVHPSGSWLAVAMRNRVVVWNLTNRTVNAEIRNVPSGVAQFTRDGAGLIVRLRGGLTLLPVHIDGNVLMLGRGESLEEAPGPPGRGALTWGRTNFLTIVTRDIARVVNLDAPDVRRYELPLTARFAAMSPDQQWLALGSGTPDGGNMIVDRATARISQRLSPEDGPAGWSPDGRFLVTATDQKFTCWDSSSWTETAQWPRESASGSPGPCGFSPDGQWLALASAPHELQVLDAGTFCDSRRFALAHREQVTAFAFSPDSNWLALGTDNGGVRLWNLPRLEQSLASIGLGQNEMTRTVVAAAIPGVSLRPAVLPLGGALAALLVAFYTFRHQRRLVASYGEIDALVIRRNEALARAQAELMRAEKMKALGTLAAGIAHDFNNLLSVIRLSNDFLARGTKTNPELKEEVDSIHRAIERGKDVVDSILGYSRAKDEAKAPVNLGELVGDTVALLSRQFLSGIRLGIEAERDTPMVHASAARLQQMMLNLIVNASEAMDGQGKLDLVVRGLAAAELPKQMVHAPKPAAGFVEIRVSDSGPGIPSEILPRIFEPFFTTKALGAKPGTGLGLATVYKIAQDEGYGIAVESTPGSGATFRVFVACVE